jgi:glucokinase
VILGIDIGGSKVALGVAAHDGRLVARRQRGPLGANPQVGLDALVADARALIAEAGVSRLEAIGIAAPGPLDRTRGVLCDPPNLPHWSEVPLVEQLSESLGAPAFLENDANAAALAEWRFGAGRGVSRLVYLTMSTGVGAGLVLDGRLYRGRRDHAGELGHTPIEWDGALCACGQRGCLEAYVGGRAWSAHLRDHAPESSRVTALAGDRQKITPVHLVAAAGQGDAYALAELDRWCRYLARGIVMAVFAFAPDRIVLGTIAAAAGERLCLAPLRALVAERIWPGLADGLRIEAAALWPDRPALAGIAAALEGLGG